MNKIGSFIKQLREAHHWSLRDLSKLTKIAPSTLSRIERGHEFNFSQLDKICKAFGEEMGDILVAAGYSNYCNPEVNSAARSVIESKEYITVDTDYHYKWLEDKQQFIYHCDCIFCYKSWWSNQPEQHDEDCPIQVFINELDLLSDRELTPAEQQYAIEHFEEWEEDLHDE